MLVGFSMFWQDLVGFWHDLVGSVCSIRVLSGVSSRMLEVLAGIGGNKEGLAGFCKC